MWLGLPLVSLAFAVACGGTTGEEANKDSAAILEEIQLEALSLQSLKQEIKEDLLTLEDARQEILKLNADIDALKKRVSPSPGVDFSRWLDRAERINDLTAALDGWLASAVFNGSSGPRAFARVSRGDNGKDQGH
jgi:hypothetical protein